MDVSGAKVGVPLLSLVNEGQPRSFCSESGTWGVGVEEERVAIVRYGLTNSSCDPPRILQFDDLVDLNGTDLGRDTRYAKMEGSTHTPSPMGS